MKRHPSLIPLSRDHHDTLIIAQSIKNGAPVYKGLPITLEGKKEMVVNHFNSHLKAHFSKEEILFDKISGNFPEIDELIIQLKQEHGEIETLVNQIENNDTMEANLNKLGLLLESHIRKEERQLFEMIPQKFEESFLAEIK